jgi:beta-lactam-binding protein with PASTA domain
MRFIQQLIKKPLWVNVLFSIGLILAFLLLFLFSLDLLTHHGKTLTIPSVTGLSYDKASEVLDDQGFDVEIQDSLYNDTAAPLTVLRQFPAADEVVKVNRTVYLTISRAVPPTVEMPILEGLSYRNAELVMKQYGLRVGDTVYKPDFARNAVLEQLYNGQRIKPGTPIAMGSAITLVLGTGLGADQLAVPDLTGLTYPEAKIIIESNGLTINLVIPDPEVTDTATAYVYRQSPERWTPDRRVNRIRIGESMDLFLSVLKPQTSADTTSLPNNDQ